MLAVVARETRSSQCPSVLCEPQNELITPNPINTKMPFYFAADELLSLL
jgi:hypothetical protein